ncbi:metal ABC transporter ATP-binding protein [Actinobacteria bacterium YIM 96077]|uniref:ABC transporter n=1 Tax=Phytoactinopolyspora halophila TaxID=1981511 RepID=A0A329R0M7_9ACTN|nr:metal ABC transporter ATP-binding protein [Phytoactinopolyspora halophila]AYY11654.1 metal ABC transporter ATP-binding protein [Actinobacteria bacterium YIM 96077]RAW17913.1 ABC transporter [Phytoactinopolyspora halophila]
MTGTTIGNASDPATGDVADHGPVVDIAGVTVRYDDVLALHDVSLTVGSSRVCGLIGMNGSGKSTLFKTMMGLIRPQAGTVRLFGSDPAHGRRRGEVAYVPQAENVDWSFPLRVRDVVMMGRYGTMSMLRRSRGVDRAAVDDALEQVDLTGLASRQIGELSGGQRKRVFVARAIAQDARLLLLDEPFSGVDARSVETICQLLRSRAAAGCAVLIATHDFDVLPEIADEAVLLHKRVLLHSTPQTVLRPENLALAFMPAETERSDGA